MNIPEMRFKATETGELHHNVNFARNEAEAIANASLECVTVYQVGPNGSANEFQIIAPRNYFD